VDAPVEGHNPTVQQVARAHQLAAKVVDEQNAVVGLHLQRSGVNAGRFIQAQFEHAGDQFTTHQDAGTFAHDPAGVHVFVVVFDGVMYHRVKDADDLAVHFHRVGN